MRECSASSGAILGNCGLEEAIMADGRAASAASNGMDTQQNLYGKIVQPLAQEPAFLLIFAICIVFGGGLSAYGVVAQSAHAQYVGLAAFALALCAAVGAIWIITHNKRASLRSPFDKDREISVQTQSLVAPAASANTVDPQKYFIDSTHGFLFRLPTSESWEKPETIIGLSNMIAARIDLEPEAAQAVVQQLNLNPFGTMLIEQSLVRFKTGQVLNLVFTEDTTTDFAENFIARLGVEYRRENPNMPEQEIDAELKKLKLNLIRGIATSVRFQNEFCVTWLDKAKLPPNLKPSMAGILLQVGSTFATTARDIKMVDKNITLTSSIFMRNVLINGQKMDLTADRWLLLTEAKDYFYLVEIAFSPQTQDSVAIWDDLKGMVESFRLLA
jgi:hypothetical protein